MHLRYVIHIRNVFYSVYLNNIYQNVNNIYSYGAKRLKTR